ncbi:MAG: hypothetical protein JO115_22265 [Pseudonocardiales bacterium]|nr:hypothetical protein [Pseudonocardiales bacterium]
MALAVVRDLRERRAPATAEELTDFETDVLAGFVLARASAGLADNTIRNDTNHLGLIRDWFGHRPSRPPRGWSTRAKLANIPDTSPRRRTSS